MWYISKNLFVATAATSWGLLSLSPPSSRTKNIMYLSSDKSTVEFIAIRKHKANTINGKASRQNTCHELCRLDIIQWFDQNSILYSSLRWVAEIDCIVFHPRINNSNMSSIEYWIYQCKSTTYVCGRLNNKIKNLFSRWRV